MGKAAPGATENGVVVVKGPEGCSWHQNSPVQSGLFTLTHRGSENITWLPSHQTYSEKQRPLLTEQRTGSRRNWGPWLEGALGCVHSVSLHFWNALGRLSVPSTFAAPKRGC